MSYTLKNCPNIYTYRYEITAVKDSINKIEEENIQTNPSNNDLTEKLNKQSEKSPACKNTANLDISEHTPIKLKPKRPTSSSSLGLNLCKQIQT